jgi:hypothetical protein
MERRKRVCGLIFVLALSSGGDLLACGDKFLVSGRGTRYQRPKNARAASVLIYANPASGLPAALKDARVESVLKREGHRSTFAETIEQLTALLAGGRYDVVLVANSVAAAVEQAIGATPEAPVVVSLCVTAAGRQEPGTDKETKCALKAPPKERHLLEAIDRAVVQHDQNVRLAAHARG